MQKVVKKLSFIPWVLNSCKWENWNFIFNLQSIFRLHKFAFAPSEISECHRTVAFKVRGIKYYKLLATQWERYITYVWAHRIPYLMSLFPDILFLDTRFCRVRARA